MLIKYQLNVKLLLVSIKVLRKIAIEITIHPNRWIVIKQVKRVFQIKCHLNKELYYITNYSHIY
jgi:hypothetical protein